MHDARPDPDALLARLNREAKAAQRGRLKIFFGASAGVGKTFDMLSQAHRRKAEGLDVLIGLVETHGRDETAKLAEGLPHLPRQSITHRGVTLAEFDLDAALARKPALLLVDELAHTNAPGARHPKRWQDIEELLAAGIDVYTALNVQHLESLNDVVTRLTGIQVRETVPDTVFDQADEVVLVDIPPDDLLQRLREGKVYLGEQVRARAADHFFKRQNLIALRELALRRMAERVDAQMALEAQPDTRAAGLSERVMVCLGPDAHSSRILRQARRMAARQRASLHAVYAETSRHYRLRPEQQEAVEHHLRLAERMGATVEVVRGEHAARALLEYAARHGITRLVVGRRVRPRLTEFLTGSLADQLVRGAGSVEVLVVANTAPSGGLLRRLLPQVTREPAGYLTVPPVLALATALLFPLQGKTDPDNLIMFYLAVVVAIAARYGTWPSVFATLLSIALFNFCFIQPYYSFTFYETGYAFTFSAMLLTGGVVGMMAGRLRVQALFFRRREQEIARLYAFTKELASLRGFDTIAECAARHIGEAYNASLSVWVPSAAEGMLTRLLGTGEADLRERGAAEWAFQHRQEAGSGTDTLPSARGLYLPLIAHEEVIGVLGVATGDPQGIDLAQRGALEAYTNILASSLLRARHAEEAESNRVEIESERLRSVLLSSISHDLRTPLASIGGITGSLLVSEQGLSNAVKDGLFSVKRQSERLGRLVGNLLNITKIELGGMSLNRQPYFIEEVIGAALQHMQDLFEQRAVSTKVSAENKLIEMDGLLIEQVLINLLENAVKFTKSDGIIRIMVSDHEQAVLVRVADNGPGVPKALQESVFEKFVTGERKDGGSGLGLAICRAIIELHGGRIWVEDNNFGGATFAFTLPLKGTA